MAFSDLYGEALTRELSSADTTELFTTARRKQGINDGMQEFIRLTGCLTRFADMGITTGVQEYDLDGLTSGRYIMLAPEGCVLRQFTGATLTGYLSGDDFVRRDIPQLDAEEPGWRLASAGTPASYYVQEVAGAVNVGLVPSPSVTSGQTWYLRATYVAKADVLTNDSDTPFSVDGDYNATLWPWYPALVHFAASKLEELRKNYAVADRQRQLFASYVADFLQRRKRRPGAQFVRMARNYLGEASGAASRPPDPRRWP